MAWKDELKNTVIKHWGNKPRFTIEDVYRFEGYFANLHPTNRHVRAKLRETLQHLRDGGIIEFVDNFGTYKVITVEVKVARKHISTCGSTHRLPTKIPQQTHFNTKLPTHLAKGYKSRSQIAGIVSEAWAEQNLFCPNCGGPLVRYPRGMHVYDFACGRCEKQYQLKSSKRPFQNTIMGAAYKPMIASVRSCKHPSFILLHYDANKMRVKDVFGIPRTAINLNNIKARKCLSNRAQHKGWQGFTITISDLSMKKKVFLVRNGRQASKSRVIKQWVKFSRIS